ncbi:hypothetical protein [Streptomyces scabiei]|uniref:hypothetical protein n=1 Tax=Streptomyces scabiei TaxID=1930 RepID=UPI0029A2BAE6|nr:hypothetical protein [Streptomyces scabiei]MDX3520717.1 hypothetical protein [Streptomyces scabiei]
MGQGNAFTPQSIKDQRVGVRRSMVPLLAMVDTADPAFTYITEALQTMKAAGVELDEAAVAIAVKLGRKKHEETRPTAWQQRRSRPERNPIVYYIRRADLIKIGTTADPHSRFSDLRPDEILAFEPGGPTEEAQRHRQFSWCRVGKRSEYFRQTSGLLAHMASLVTEHGAPDPTWPTVESIGKGHLRTRAKLVLPKPVTGETVTAADGAKILGMNKNTVASWAHRKMITPVGKDEKGRPVYYLEHMSFLIQRGREWMNRKPSSVLRQ